jgi:hypothetical protein
VAINESFLKSPFAEAFLKACAILQHAVVIPEIVLDELKGNFPKKLQEKSLALLKAGNDVSKLIDIDIPKISVDDAADHYDDWLESLIETHNIVISPYPNIPPKELIEKSYEMKKPFKDSGEGHKDYVVWKTVREGVNAETAWPPFIFLTNNTKDFCELDQSGKHILHSDLSSEIDVPARTPIIYTSIKAAFDTELSPNLEGMSLDDIPSLENDIDSMVGEFLLQELPHNSINALDGMPFNDEISISSVGAHSINAVTLKKVGEEVIITVTGMVDIEVLGFMDKFDFYQHDGADVFVVDGNWNDHVMLVSSAIETPFELTIFYSTIEHVVTGREVSLLDEIEDEWPYK